ncbi:hypothetical protein APSETT445_006113 [Aspergillus pseudonomiae]
MTTIRLDVNLFNGKDDSVKRTNCVPLKDFDISDKKLSDVRSVLIKNGGLDASKVGCSFCSPSGALVNDASSFSDYVDIISEGAEEKEGDDQKKKNTYNVYIYLKSKKTTTGLSDEVKETLKKELNLKLSDKPELLKTSLDQLTSSFNKADWVAEASENATNPSDMSEKEWNVVIRNNSLTSASRLVFSNLGRASDGSKKLKFRRIERAPYSGGAFGFSAAISAGFSSSESSALSKQSTAESSTMNITYNFPRVVLHLDEYSLDLSDECSQDLVRVKDVNSLIAFHHKYGMDAPQEDVIPLGDFIGRIPGYEDIPEKFNKLAEITRKKETISFRLGLDAWQRADKNKPEYLSLHHAWLIRQDVVQWCAKRLLKDIQQSGKPYNIFDQANWANNRVPSEIQTLYDCGHPGVTFADNSDETVFDVEVETLMNQAPALQYGHRYHLFNRKRGLWLRAINVNYIGTEVTVLAAGPKHEATLFEFRDKDREGPMHNGDKCCLLVYGPDGKQKGIVALSLRGLNPDDGAEGANSIGALPYSVPNEGRIRFTVLEMVDQADVPV